MRKQFLMVSRTCCDDWSFRGGSQLLEGTILVVIIYKHTKFLESPSRAKYHVPLQSNLHRCNTVKFENNYGAQASRMSSASVMIGRGTASPSF